jgi:hypothetical protein
MGAISLTAFTFQEKTTIVLDEIESELRAGFSLFDCIAWFHK